MELPDLSFRSRGKSNLYERVGAETFLSLERWGRNNLSLRWQLRSYDAQLLAAGFLGVPSSKAPANTIGMGVTTISKPAIAIMPILDCAFDFR